MPNFADYLFMIVLPTLAIATVLVRWLEGAADRLEHVALAKDLVSNAADISMRIDHLERVMLSPEDVDMPERSR